MLPTSTPRAVNKFPKNATGASARWTPFAHPTYFRCRDGPIARVSQTIRAVPLLVVFILKWCQRPGLNRRPKAYESSALPLSYSGILFLSTVLRS